MRKISCSKDIVVKSSPIQGVGVFANRDFKKGETVAHWNPVKIIAKEKLNTLSAEEKRFSSLLNNQYLVLGEPARYINHSCEPNTRSEDGRDIASRDILKGEEITGNYIEENVPSIFECKCGSSKCRGILKT